MKVEPRFEGKENNNYTRYLGRTRHECKSGLTPNCPMHGGYKKSVKLFVQVDSFQRQTIIFYEPG